MKKIILNGALLGINLLLLFQSTTAQTSLPAQKVSFAAEKNQAKTAGSKGDEQGWRQLFNGKDLTGWKHVGKGDMLVEDGMIHGKGGMGLLYYPKQKFGNCTFRVVYK